MVDQFNKSESTFVFLISSNAGGVGLNLTGGKRRCQRPAMVIMLSCMRLLFSMRGAEAHINGIQKPTQPPTSPSLSAMQPPTRSSFSTPLGTQPWTCVSVLFFTRGCAFVDFPAKHRCAPLPSKTPVCAQRLRRLSCISVQASQSQFSIALSACPLHITLPAYPLHTPQRRRTARSGWARRGT